MSTTTAPVLCPWSPSETIAHFGGDEKLVRELIGLFLGSYARHLERLHTRHREGDLPGLGRAAHAVKGSLSNFTASAPTTTALRLEQLCGRGQGDGAAATLERLVQEIEALAAAMRVFHGEAS